jgi:uncharacterized protein
MAGTKPITSLLIKPAGPDCNLACEYCFYTPKRRLYPREKRHRMSRKVAEEMIRQYMAMADGTATFAWQGGEPTLMGIDFFRLVTALQMKHGSGGQVVANALQTNGTLIDDEWARFLRRYQFLVGISIDGPSEIHDKWRVNHTGGPSLAQVIRGLRALQDEDVEHNALVMLTSHSWDKPRIIWDYLHDLGVDFMQFIPCLERDPETGEMSQYSVTPEQWGRFMCEIFDLWWATGTTAPGEDCPCPTTYVRLFNDLVEIYAGGEGPSCMLKERCGEYVVIEHNGDVYACDFFVDKDHYAGNILKTSLSQLIHSGVLEEFALAKGRAGPECQTCPWWEQCFGGCPKDRVYGSGHTECATYLCKGYQMLYEHADERLRKLADSHTHRSDQCPTCIPPGENQ